MISQRTICLPNRNLQNKTRIIPKQMMNKLMFRILLPKIMQNKKRGQYDRVFYILYILTLAFSSE